MKILILPRNLSGEPEVTAMLQAFYSRSVEGIESRLGRLGSDTSKVKAALKKFYIGYGHNSIADCGTATLFIEGVSILAAKAIQEDPLYNGQECSTRYLELSGDMYEHAHVEADAWVEAQQALLPKLIGGVRLQHPFEQDAGLDPVVDDLQNTRDLTAWENATAAKAFDVARGWIPCAMLTNLSVHMTLRKLNEMTARLLGHPLTEVRMLASDMRLKMVLAYPDACQPFTSAEVAYADWLITAPEHWYEQRVNDPCAEPHTHVRSYLSEYDKAFIANRPRHAPLPHMLNSPANGQVTISGSMDFAGWRDLQRHRRQYGLPPLVTGESGFNKWYLDEAKSYLSPPDYDVLESHTEVLLRATIFNSVPVHRQYSLPMGVNVPYEYTMGLAQAVYLAELRSGNTVHPIVRIIAQDLARKLVEIGIRVDYDDKPARFDVKRGFQTITEKAE